ncbi:DNA repair and recombination protein RAD5C [Hypomontagnella submonticulosa]|nr:DNA repair and recombination protein RAD5C [Hypomontagnella submonticulosa]
MSLTGLMPHSSDPRVITSLLKYDIRASLTEENDLRPFERSLWEYKISGRGEIRRSQTAANCFGGIIADDMGLGKTLTMPAAIVRSMDTGQEFARSNGKRAAKSIFVVSPELLLNTWMKETDKHMCHGTIRSTKYHGSERRGYAARLGEYGISFTEYGTVTAESERRNSALWDIKWFRLVPDEGTYHYSPDFPPSANNIASHIRWCSTGTPLQSSLDDLGSLVRFLITLQEREQYSNLELAIKRKIAFAAKERPPELIPQPDQILSLFQQSDEALCSCCPSGFLSTSRLVDSDAVYMILCLHPVCNEYLPEYPTKYRDSGSRTCPSNSDLTYMDIKTLDLVGKALSNNHIKHWCVDGDVTSRKRNNILAEVQSRSASRISIMTFSTDVAEILHQPLSLLTHQKRVFRIDQASKAIVIRYAMQKSIEEMVQSGQLRKLRLTGGGFRSLPVQNERHEQKAGQVRQLAIGLNVGL